MEIIDNALYSALELSTAPQAQNDYRPQQKASSSRCSFSHHMTIASGLLSSILMSVLLCIWTLCWSSQHTTCASCPCCPDFWMGYGDHCYYFSMERKDWNSSLEFCLAKGSQLLMFTDNQEMKYLMDQNTRVLFDFKELIGQRLRKKRYLGKGGESKKTQKRIREGKREARAEKYFSQNKI